MFGSPWRFYKPLEFGGVGEALGRGAQGDLVASELLKNAEQD